MSLDLKYEKLLTKVAANIKRIRKEKGLTVTDMVEYGFEDRNYRRLESGKQSPSLYTLLRIAQAFKVDISEFFAGK